MEMNSRAEIPTTDERIACKMGSQRWGGEIGFWRLANGDDSVTADANVRRVFYGIAWPSFRISLDGRSCDSRRYS
jgi:hypothetical protein